MLKQEYRHTDSRIEKPVDSRAYIQTAEDPHAKLVNDVHERVRKHLHENPNQFKGGRGDTGPEWRREDAATLVQEIVRQELPGIVRSELASGDFRGPEGKAGATSEEIFKDVLFLVEENILNPAHNERFRGPKGESIVGPAGAPGKDSIVPGPQGQKGEPGRSSGAEG